MQLTPQPMIVVHDVEATSAWYQRVLGLRSGHGGPEYEMLMSGERLVLQLHRWEAHEPARPPEGRIPEGAARRYSSEPARPPEGLMPEHDVRRYPNEHPHLGEPDLRPHGNGTLLWFETDAFDAAVQRIRQAGATVLEGPLVNPDAQHREIWLRDPNGYKVVVASAYGDLAAAEGGA
jgi:catechol 2,3-dioxygenase-like lactoylglutathione lyase family enzyme